ncbi:hypothetical protein [Hymenobacter psoromatis]|uniref:hypothetical protein n=1 Tax=Hymenobacter psoromatis TaxID=1484116 RepID=UPI001CBC2F75|nr:hypothetical protein [Hymenobacter psoromatis]
METHVTGQPVPGELRRHILAALPGNHPFSEVEHIQTNPFTRKCQGIARLICWETSMWVKVACCEAEAARQRPYYATNGRLRHLRAMPFRDHYLHSPRPWLTWVVGAPLPDHRVNTFDRLAARFQLANVLSLNLLHNRQAR